MFCKSFLICSLFFLLTGCSSEQSAKHASKTVSLMGKAEPSEAFVPATINLVGIGDSLTRGLGDESDHGGYFGMVKEMLEQQDEIKEVLIDNYGVIGYKTSNLQNKLSEEDVMASIKEADIILMTVGGNDLMGVVRNHLFSLDFEPFRKEQKHFENRMRDIFTEIRELNSSAYIVYVGLYNPFTYMLSELPELDTIIDEWNRASQQIVSKDGNAVFVKVDHLFSSVDDDTLLYKDKFHPNENGYSIIADQVFEAIIEYPLDRFANQQ
ncbi:SGNH/GDSL hydrolase family protein [Metabacillus litoralis]|nr:SGNH/GDSL hydrolase family protein [Metabacillus litoralis]